MLTRRLLALPLFAVALALWCAAAASPTHAAAAPSAAVSPALAKLAASSSPTAQLPVLVYGMDLDAANAASGATVRKSLSQIGGESASVAAGSLATLAAQPGISYVTSDPVMHATGSVTPSADTLATTYPVVDGATRAWAQGLDGKGVGIAVIDSGVTKLDDFGNRAEQVSLPGQLPTSLDDSYGHGTFVASVAAGKSADGRYAGVAPGASVYALNVSRPDGVRSSDVMSALFWVLQHAKADRIGVVNISLSETVESSYRTSALDNVVEMLWHRGIAVVVSAGNTGPGTTSHAPGNDPYAITVGATDTADTAATDDDTVASWSSSGVTTDGFAKPELLAPGLHIVAPQPAGTILDQHAPADNHVAPGHLRLNGASFSAPQVAAPLAFLLQAHPEWTPDQLKWVLMSTGRGLSGAIGVALDAGAASSFAGTPGLANVAVPVATPPAPVSVTTPQPEPCPLTTTPACAAALAREAAAQRFDASRQWQTAAASWDQAGASWTAAQLTVRAALAEQHAAADEEQLLLVAPNGPNQSALAQRAAASWAAAAAGFTRAASWDVAAECSAAAAVDFARAASWDQAAASWDEAAVDWSRAASWDQAAASWDAEADAQVSGDHFDQGAASWDLAATAWARAASWDNAATDWQKAASWDDTPVWDRAASWDAAASWDRAASWDEAVSGDE